MQILKGPSDLPHQQLWVRWGQPPADSDACSSWRSFLDKSPQPILADDPAAWSRNVTNLENVLSALPPLAWFFPVSLRLHIASLFSVYLCFWLRFSMSVSKLSSHVFLLLALALPISVRVSLRLCLYVCLHVTLLPTASTSRGVSAFHYVLVSPARGRRPSA